MEEKPDHFLSKRTWTTENFKYIPTINRTNNGTSRDYHTKPMLKRILSQDRPKAVTSISSSNDKDDGQICQLIEKNEIFGRPVRLYSDGSIKAVTSTGWQRFDQWKEFVAYCTRDKN